MILLLATALAHPLVAHVVDHHVEWSVDAEGSQLRYVVDVPHAFGRDEGELLGELQGGLLLSWDGRTVALRRSAAKSRPVADATRVTLTLTAAHGTGRLVLSNANLLDAGGRYHRRVRLGAAVDATSPPDAPPLVTMDGRARQLELTTTKVSLAERAHRWLVQRPARVDHPVPTSSLWHNTSTPGFALAAALGLGLLGSTAPHEPTGRSRVWHYGAVVAGLAAWFTPPSALGLWLLAALGALLARDPRAHGFVATCVACSTPVRGLGLVVAAIALTVPARPMPARVGTALWVGLIALQAARIVSSG